MGQQLNREAGRLLGWVTELIEHGEDILAAVGSEDFAADGLDDVLNVLRAERANLAQLATGRDGNCVAFPDYTYMTDKRRARGGR